MQRALFTFFALAIITANSGALADIAHLRNGEWLEVTSFRLDGDFVYLDIEGGGQVALPNAQVLEIRRSPGGLRFSNLESRTAARSLEAPPAPLQPVEDHLNPIPAPLDEELAAGAVFDPSQMRALAGRVARRHGLSASLVQAVVLVESRFDAFAVSPRGAMGLMQLMPQTARRFDVDDVFDPVNNLDGGVRYLKELLARYNGETQLALAAYNAGEQAVDRYGGIPPYRETMQYVDKVLAAIRRR